MCADPHKPDAWLLGADAGEIVQLHPDGGWPEFTMTLRFYVTSDDPEVVADVQRRVLERDWDPGGWTRDGRDSRDHEIELRERAERAEAAARDFAKALAYAPTAPATRFHQLEVLSRHPGFLESA